MPEERARPRPQLTSSLPRCQDVLAEDGCGGIACLSGNGDGVGDIFGRGASHSGTGVLEAIAGAADPAERAECAHRRTELRDDRLLNSDVPPTAGSPQPWAASRPAALFRSAS